MNGELSPFLSNARLSLKVQCREKKSFLRGYHTDSTSLGTRPTSTRIKKSGEEVSEGIKSASVFSPHLYRASLA